MPLPRYVNREATALGPVELILRCPTGVIADRKVIGSWALYDQEGQHLDNVTLDVTALIPASLKTTLSNALTSARTLGQTDILPQ